MYVGGVLWGELAVMKCMHGEHWGEQWWLKPPHAALFPTWLPVVVHRTNGAQLDLTERDASVKRQNGQGEETGGFKTEPWSIYLFICSHLMFIFPLCWEKNYIFPALKMELLCLSPQGVVTPTFWFIQYKTVGIIVSCCLGRSSCTRQFCCILDNSLIVLCLFPKSVCIPAYTSLLNIPGVL